MNAETRAGQDCWNRIGVWSAAGASCERLAEFIHCRNCDVFIAAGRQIFERESPLEYQQENLSVLAETPADGAHDRVGVIIFRLGRELFALPSSVFESITESRSIHRLPHIKSPYIRGVVNISGEICLCHSLSSVLDVEMLNEAPSERHVYRRIAVIRIEGDRYVFPVDEVRGMLQYRTDTLKTPPATISDEIKQLVRGAIHFEGDDIAVLDADRLHRLLADI